MDWLQNHKMSSIFLAIFCFLTIALICFSCISPTSGEPVLLQVNLLFRHGDRSPTKTFPTDVYQEGFWPRGWGQLSKKGQLRHLQLGKFLRKNYGDFLAPFYNPEEIYIRSTDVDRTLMSAQSNLAGLFPPHLNETWSADIAGWQPLPVHTVPHKSDMLLVRGNNCPRYQNMQHDVWVKNPVPEVVTENTKYKDLWDTVRKGAGVTDTIENMWYIPDSIKIEYLNNLTLPAWVTPSIFDHLMSFKDLGFQMMVYNRSMARLAGGNLLKKIQSNMKAKIEKESKRKMFMYSAHDDTVAPLLAALGVYNNLAPPYASCVLVELWQDVSNGYYVRVLYRNDTSIVPKNPLLLTIPGCAENCSWSDFLKTTKESIPVDYEAECRLPPGTLVHQKLHDSVGYGQDTKTDFVNQFEMNDDMPKPFSPSGPTSQVWFGVAVTTLVTSILFLIAFVMFAFLTGKRRDGYSKLGYDEVYGSGAVGPA